MLIYQLSGHMILCSFLNHQDLQLFPKLNGNWRDTDVGCTYIQSHMIKV